ncbi:MAG: carbon storage regulator [Planctomycetales bacterium]|nr:carbon storage regulator [Planctomycetales bacterium]MBN8624345.1 carbon storage regulator [Planctomycetota bacterium]
MLVLSRKQGEQIRIGDNIVVTVHRLSGNRVSLGIEAPADCKIMRGELQEILARVEVQLPAKSKSFGENRIAQIIEKSLRSAK